MIHLAEEETKEASEPTTKNPKDMGWHEWLDYSVRKMDYIDMKLMGWAAVIIGLVIGAHFPTYITPYWIPLAVLAVIFYIRPLKHMFG